MSRDLHPWRIRDVGDGNAGWVQGRLVGEPPLVAPFSKRPCFYYSALVEGAGGSTKGADELMIDDDTGRAIVELAGAVVQVEFDHTEEGPQRISVDGRYIPGARIREGILAPGEVIAVHGHCSWERDPSPAQYGLYRDPLPQRLRITATTRVKLWVTELITPGGR